MKMILFILLTGFGLSGFAQENRLQGRVISADEKLANVSISLLKAVDSSLVKIAITDSRGVFMFSELREDNYLLRLSSIGYQSIYHKARPGDSLEITMHAVSEQLGAVTVIAARPLVEVRADKMIVNVDASPSNAAANVLELLEKSPGISVDQDGNIRLMGKSGALVMVDGKQTYLSGQDLANLLRSMPASQLDQVEIMTQPSARFDAAGSSGIINLKTKKEKKMGFNGSLNLGYVQGYYPKSPNSFNFNYRKNNLSLFTNIGLSSWKSFNDQTIYRHFGERGRGNYFSQVGNSVNENSNFNIRLGGDYEIDGKNTIGAMVFSQNMRSNGRSFGAGTFQTDNLPYIDSLIKSMNQEKDHIRNNSVNLNYRRQINTRGRTFSADLDFVSYRARQEQFTENRVFDRNGMESPFFLRAILPSHIKILSGKADYSHPLSADAKLEAGVKASQVNTDNNAPYESYDFNTEKWVDDRRKDHFRYEERISAAYINFNTKWNKIAMQAGLRAEHTFSTGTQVLIDKEISRDFLQLFPTAYLSYSLNEANQLSANYGRRIDRPNYRDLNPFQYFLDLYTFNQGNPYLKPQFSHNIELLHVYKGKLSSKLNFLQTNDVINDVLKQNDLTKVTYQTKENVARVQTLGLSVSYNAAVTPWWTTSVFGQVFQNSYKGMINNEMLSRSLTAYSFNMNQQFKFAKTWSAEMSGFYMSKHFATGMFLIKPIYVLSFGAAKQIMKSKGSLKLSVIDPFAIQKVFVDVKHSNIDMYVKNVWDNRRVGISFTYRFARGEGVQQRVKSGSAVDEQQRIGSN